MEMRQMMHNRHTCLFRLLVQAVNNQIELCAIVRKRVCETVIVLVENDRDDVRSEIENRLSETIAQEAREMAQICSALPKQKRRKYRRDHRLRKPTVIVRQGDTFSH